MHVRSSTDAAPNWENLLYLTCLTCLSMSCAMDLGVPVELSHMPGLGILKLTDYSLQADAVNHLLHLQELGLTLGHDKPRNLESCKQLTRPELVFSGQNLKQLILPFGESVRLQHLRI